MLLKFSTFRYNNVNRTSKAKVEESCHSIISNTIYFNWRNFRDRIFRLVGGKIRKNYFRKKYFHPLPTDIFPRNTFFKLFHENKFPRKILSGLFCENKITKKKHFRENKYQDLSKKFQYI